MRQQIEKWATRFGLAGFGLMVIQVIGTPFGIHMQLGYLKMADGGQVIDLFSIGWVMVMLAAIVIKIFLGDTRPQASNTASND
jgi:hypothetical protein